MRYSFPICALGIFALSVGLGSLAAAPEDVIARFDFEHPTTLLPIVAAGFQELQSVIRGWVDTAFRELRDVLQRTRSWESLPR